MKTRKSRSITCLFSGALALTLLLTGCGDKGNNTSAPATSSTVNTSDGTSQTTSGGTSNGSGMQNYGKTVSVSDIKNAYGSMENDDIMPLYNVEPDEVFEFKFKSDWYDSSYDIQPWDMVTVHTDPACTEQSQLYASALFDEDGTTLRVSPIGGVLTTEAEEHGTIEDDIEVWGNASMYYIAVWVDLDAEGFVKLDKPVVIPFTVKHELAIPTLKGVVDSTGRFKLVWNKVEGATSYNIYWYGNTDRNRTGEFNEPVAGADYAYDVHGDEHLLWDAETTETEFDCFAGKDHGLAIHYHDELDDDDTDFIIGQNYSVCGSYFVTAVFGDKESGLSNIVNTSDLVIPYVIVDEDDIIFRRMDSEADLPQTVRVKNIDGSITERSVTYKFHWGKTLLGMDYPYYRYSVEGTAITGECSMDILNGKMEYYRTKKEGDAPTGFVDNSTDTSTKADPENNTTFNPDSSVPTIIETDPSDPEVDPTESETLPNESESLPDTSESLPESSIPESEPAAEPNDSDNQTLVERQLENTEEHIEKGNKDFVEQTEYAVFAESAEEEWLARNLIAGNERISFAAFPSLQQYDNLMDVFQKVYYQNPYVLGVVSYKYDYGTLALHVKYCYSKSELEEKQDEILAEANAIIKANITDGMSAEEKCRTIYDYFNANTAYDNNAVAEAEKNNFKKGEDWKDSEDAFNAHGIIVDKKGVCQSYALSYKLLCSMSGVEAKVITGYLNGNLPHAWNSVNLDGKWYQTDCTNNATNCGIPFFLYEAGKDDLAMTGYTEDKLYDLDTAVGTFSVSDSEREYYTANGLCAASVDEFKTVLGRCLDNGEKTITIRYIGEFPQNDIVNAVREVYNMKGMEDKLHSLGFGYSNSFVLLISNPAG
ncbi:MAG: hypothetical protein K2J80_11895 [Oscillospiraceae bacterium]|nr:hypothetical protein [Oscillospiraceae bacterium]